MSATTTVTLCVAVVFFAASATSVAVENSLEESLKKCALHDDDRLRLACLDAVIVTINEESPPPGTADPKDPDPPRSASVRPEYVEHSNDGKVEQTEVESHADDTLTYNVVNTYQDRGKRWYFEMQNGDVWRQTEARYLPALKQFPVEVRITKGIFGSHNMRADQFYGSIKVKKHR